MKILFLCGSVEPGKDGVGDYTRRLSGQLIRTGHEAQILSLCDKQSSHFVTETQVIDETPIKVSRIPLSTSNKQRLVWSRAILKTTSPDWISLQFVPYSFHPKGLPFWLPRFAKSLKGNHRWHVMFHELWIGIEKEANVKFKLVGFLQKQIIKNINNNCAPKVNHTQTKIYQHYLGRINIATNYLPLFGNVAVTARKDTNSEFMVFVVFATIHDKVPIEEFIIDLKHEVLVLRKTLKFVFLGRSGNLLGSWTAVLDRHCILYELFGVSSVEKISRVLKNGNYGISTTPYKISDKSGVVAAMREHNLPIISVAKSWTDRDEIAISFKDIILYKKGDLSLVKTSEAWDNSLSTICANFMNSIINY